MMAKERREMLESFLKAARENGELKVLGGDPLDLLITEVKELWRVMDSLKAYLYLPEDEDVENNLIIAYESYFEKGSKG